MTQTKAKMACGETVTFMGWAFCLHIRRLLTQSANSAEEIIYSSFDCLRLTVHSWSPRYKQGISILGIYNEIVMPKKPLLMTITNSPTQNSWKNYIE